MEIKCQLDATDDFYCRSYCLLNMFQAPLCPSSGAREYYTVGCCLSYLVLWLSSCRYGVELRVVCPVCWLLLQICNKKKSVASTWHLFPHINDDARWKSLHIHYLLIHSSPHNISNQDVPNRHTIPNCHLFFLTISDNCVLYGFYCVVSFVYIYSYLSVLL